MATPVITKDQMFPLLLEACPSFSREWESFVEEWAAEAELPLYVALGQFARHLVSKLAAGETERLGAVFAVVERLITEGDNYVKNAAIVGLLEDLQNANLHTTTEPEQFRTFLHPASGRYWDKLNDFWLHGRLITDD